MNTKEKNAKTTKNSLTAEDGGLISFKEINKIKPGYFWYHDDTFSKDFLPNKELKALVEIVEDKVIYGNLTVNAHYEEYFAEYKKQSTWKGCRDFRSVYVFSALRYLTFDELSKLLNSDIYPCKQNEKLVLYTRRQFEELKKVGNMLEKILIKFKNPYKVFRVYDEWTSSYFYDNDNDGRKYHLYCKGINYNFGYTEAMDAKKAYTPVLAMKVK